MSRELKSFLIRASLFLLFGRYFFIASVFLLCCLMWCLIFFYFDDDFGVAIIMSFGVVISILPAFYLIAKLLGLFESLERLKINTFFKVLVVLFLDFLFTLVMAVLDYSELTVQSRGSLLSYLKDYYFSNSFSDIFSFFNKTSFLFGLLLSYLFYRFFAFLTKRFPVPFEKIGYYSSREFWVCLMKRLKNVKRT